MRARLVVPRQRFAATISAALYFATSAALAVFLHIEEYRYWAYLAGSAALVVTAIVPWIALHWRSRAQDVTLTRGSARIGLRTFERAKLSGFSVAPDGRGVSVAIGEGDSVTFLEMDRMEDARTLARAINVEFPREGTVRAKLPRVSLVSVIGLVSAIELFFAVYLPNVMYLLYEREQVPYLLGSVLLGLLTLALVMLRMRAPMQVTWGHVQTAASRGLDRSPEERHVKRHVEHALREDPAPPRVRVEALERKDETTAEWLARVDALPSGDAYRGDAFPKEALHEVLADDTSSIDVRLAAARMLHRRGGEDGDALVRVANDEEVRARIAAVVDDDPAEVTAERLDNVGPMFRNR